MKHFFYMLWDRLKRASTLETDSPGEKRRKVTLVVIAILSCVCGIISGTNSSITSGLNVYALIPFSFTIIVGAAMLIFFITKRFGLLLYPFLLMILCTPALFQWSIGGIASPASITIIFWSILAPFGSLMFQDARKASCWFVAYLGLVAVSLSFDTYFSRFAAPSPHGELIIGHGINIVWFSITIFFTMLYFVNAFQKEHFRAEQLVVELTETNSELETTLHELKETQTELVQSEKMAALGKLAAGIAHEINNPIGALKSAADSSTRCISKMEHYFGEREKVDETKNDAQLQKLFQIIKDNSQVFSSASGRVAQTVSSFINFARLDEAEFDRVDIHQGLDNTLTLIQHEMKTGTTVVKAYGDIPKIACYPGELNQVFMHLLTNAAEAITGKGTITIRTFQENRNIQIQISDTGIGIAQDRIQHLFDPDFTKEGSRVKAGLGLFTSYNIIQKHRGEIRVESEVGKGSTFTIILPVT
jgi:signal transduction histidine kinase